MIGKGRKIWRQFEKVAQGDLAAPGFFFFSVSLLRWAFLQELFVFWHYAALSHDSRYFQKRLNLSA